MTEERHSTAAEPEIISDPIALAEREVQNGLLQYKAVVDWSALSLRLQQGGAAAMEWMDRGATQLRRHTNVGVLARLHAAPIDLLSGVVKFPSQVGSVT